MIEYLFSRYFLKTNKKEQGVKNFGYFNHFALTFNFSFGF